MDSNVRPVVAGAVKDLERACDAIDSLNRRPMATVDAGFELGEASQAAHRALLVLRGWDWAPGIGTAATPLAVDAN